MLADVAGAGQNKNRFLIWWALWLVMNGWCTSVRVCMMLAGHTKFIVDRFFGLVKMLLQGQHGRGGLTVPDTLAEMVAEPRTTTSASTPYLVHRTHP